MKNTLPKRNLSSSKRGFALAEVVVALFAVTLVMFVVAALTKQVASLSRSGKQTGAVVEFTNRSTALLSNIPGWLAQMRLSVTGSGGSSVYTQCLPNTLAGIYNCPAPDAALLTELGTRAAGFAAASYTDIVDTGGRRLAGTPTAPMYLNSDGIECIGTDAAKCEFMSTGYFLRENSVAGENPGDVKFLVKLEKNPAPTLSNQNTLAMKPKFMSLDIGRAWVKPSSPADCPKGVGIMKVGYLSDGTPQCMKAGTSCDTGKIQLGLDSNSDLICSAPPTNCPSGQKVILSQANSQLMCTSDSPCTGTGHIFIGFYSTGEPMCVLNTSSSPCPNGQVQMGQLAGGSPFCVPTQTCDPSAPLLTFNGTSFTCTSDTTADTIVSTECPSGQSVVKINTDGSAVCAAPDRKLAGTYLECPDGQYVFGLWQDGSVKCKALNGAPVVNTPPVAPPVVASSCVPWINQKAWPAHIKNEVDGGNGWRKVSDKHPLARESYIAWKHSECRNKGGIVSDVDITSDVFIALEYCSERYGQAAMPAAKRGTCKTWKEEKVRRRDHNCLCV